MDLYKAHKANPDTFPQYSLKDTLFLYYSCPQKDNILKLYSKHIQFNFTISGKRVLHFGDQKYLANENTGFMLKRCAFLQEMTSDYSGWDVLVFYLKDDYLRSIFDDFKPHLKLNNLPDVTSEVKLSFEINDQIRNCYNSFIPYFGRETQLPEGILENKFKELLFTIFSHPNNKHILAYILSIVDEYETPIWEVMENNYRVNLNLEAFADIANRSLSKFKRDFYAYYKTTPGKWLIERRLQLAKSQLTTSKKSIQEIAFDCGFNNASHFSRVFKEQFNMSPSNYKVEKTTT
ncbi:MAG: helix-turn-helix transcriptional regulator [Algicola sp.]|nr:helix-turn-helix transcriptional regulator [Algicola sp.]